MNSIKKADDIQDIYVFNSHLDRIFLMYLEEEIERVEQEKHLNIFTVDVNFGGKKCRKATIQRNRMNKIVRIIESHTHISRKYIETVKRAKCK